MKRALIGVGGAACLVLSGIAMSAGQGGTDDGPRDATCPCWSATELGGLPSPTAESFTSCEMDTSNATVGNHDRWLLVETASGSPTQVSTTETRDSESGNECEVSSFCADGSCPQLTRKLDSLTDAEFTACERDVALSGADRGFECFVDSPPR